MGASLSNLTEGGSTTGDGPGLGDIPEDCVTCVFMNLTPPEICNLARLNRAFRGAASSDTVWESKLPHNYQDLLDLMPPERYQNLCKKDIFALLSRPVPFDDGNKASASNSLFFLSYGILQEVWLDRVTGKVCMSISTKAMAITGIEDRRYWNWVPTEESRFNIAAYLQQIWWFEVDGSLKFPFPADVYTLSFRIHLGRFSKRLGRRVCNFEHTHGWDIKPVKFELSTSDGQEASTECFLDDCDKDEANGNQKRGCWMEYKVGEFIVSASDLATEVRFSMKQIDCTHSKGGIYVDNVSIIPSDLKASRRRVLK
ncbi:F-box domain, cyclin-like protein [Cynara cardunculus var. scolymus]|uniref:F-box domain, cyclin-like protein n=1 Tax=Cynara cardunculus var. scolymus TaxID=59895 RepID=A0A118JU45_CYNCS|nr:F-box domain, cyclin-like protein [Cynara cardunculus var. scolymus]